MFTTTVDKKTLGEVNALLISGTSLKETAELSGLDYTKVHYLRSKLVKAGALQPLHSSRKKRATRNNRLQKQAVTQVNNVSNQAENGIKLVINGIKLNIRNVKAVDVAAGHVDIQY